MDERCTTLHLTNIPEDVLTELARRAAQNGTSVSAETLAALILALQQRGLLPREDEPCEPRDG